MSKIKDDVKKQIEKRRTFAIISHPDAGKTTLTEQLLLLYCSSIMEDIVSTFWTHRDIRTSQRIHTVL